MALTLQGVFFQFGGITTLGVNTVIMALPAVCCYLIFKGLIRKPGKLATAAAFSAGFAAVLLSGLLVGACLIFTEENFIEVAGIILGAHFPVMVIEGIITAVCVTFLRKVRPEMLAPGSDSFHL